MGTIIVYTIRNLTTKKDYNFKSFKEAIESYLGMVNDMKDAFIPKGEIMFIRRVGVRLYLDDVKFMKLNQLSTATQYLNSIGYGADNKVEFINLTWWNNASQIIEDKVVVTNEYMPWTSGEWFDILLHNEEDVN